MNSPRLRLPGVAEPLLSVVMVTYGRFELVRRAIAALVENTEPSFELLLVDNASPDGTGHLLERAFDGARVLLNSENLGFGAANNQGAEAARGELLCLLNSDALVQPGWLPPLRATLSDATVGTAVPMFLNEDGTIQEAGSVVDSLGWPLAFGAGDDPKTLEHRLRREGDYGSAACMLLRRADFLEVGGFDSVFGGGYFEDVDLCFRLKDRGLRTVYEPRSRVVHIRHGSTGAERASELMRENRSLFWNRWRGRLAARPAVADLSTSRRRRVVARDAEALERILVIDDRVPHTDYGSGDPRMAKLLHELAALWPSGRITLFASDRRNAERYAEPLIEQGVEVAYSSGPGWEKWFDERRFHYSVVIVSRPENIERFNGILRRTQPQALRVYDVEALASRRLELAAGVAADGQRGVELLRQAAQIRSVEAQAITSADAIFCVTHDERDVIAEVAPEKPIFLLPTWVETTDSPAGFDQRSDLIFFGGFLGGAGSPNEDALLHLVEHILPSVQSELPGVKLRVVGAGPPPKVQALASASIEVVGYVDDPGEWLGRARVHVNPLRFGAGIKLKLIDSMAAGLPFVTSHVGAEGLGLGELESEIVADDPVDIAARVVRIYRDQETWDTVAAGLLTLVRARYSREAFRESLVEAMGELAVAPPSRRRRAAIG